MGKFMNEPTFHDLVIPEPLWEFLSFCEVYCTAACCEDKAFEQHHSLIRRKWLDMNIRGDDGRAKFKEAKSQLEEVLRAVNKIRAKGQHDQVLVWRGAHEGPHEYQLNYSIAPEWFNKWKIVFDEIHFQ